MNRLSCAGKELAAATRSFEQALGPFPGHFLGFSVGIDLGGSSDLHVPETVQRSGDRGVQLRGLEMSVDMELKTTRMKTGAEERKEKRIQLKTERQAERVYFQLAGERSQEASRFGASQAGYDRA